MITIYLSYHIYASDLSIYYPQYFYLKKIQGVYDLWFYFTLLNFSMAFIVCIIILSLKIMQGLYLRKIRYTCQIALVLVSSKSFHYFLMKLFFF